MKIFKYSQKYIHFFDFEEVTSNFELAYVFPCTICYQIDNICIIIGQINTLVLFCCYFSWGPHRNRETTIIEQNFLTCLD